MSKTKDVVPVNRTRLYHPPFTADYLSRDALETSFEEIIGLASTVFSASAGFDKSSLISRWLDNSDFTVTSQTCHPLFYCQG